MKKIFAKSVKNGNVTLIDHTKMVLNMGMCIAKRFSVSIDKISIFERKLALALALHDIGKCSSDFQKYIKKKDCDDNGLEVNEKSQFNHNILSWAFAACCVNGLYKETDVMSPILYHHLVYGNLQKDDTAKKIMSGVIDNDSEGYAAMCEFYEEIYTYIKDTFNIDFGDKYHLISDVEEMEGDYMNVENILLHPKAVPGNGKYKDFRKTMETVSFNSLIRAIVVYSDRCISSMAVDNNRILNNDTDYINAIFMSSMVVKSVSPNLDDYDKSRLKIQMDIVDEIYKSSIKTHVLQACAGFGKTLMGLLWYFKNGGKTMWVLPRNVIARGTYNSVIEELTKMGVNSQVKVGLYIGGEFEDCNYCKADDCRIQDCDIFITNIDNFLKFYSKNNMSTLLVNSYTWNVIFDEYHEFVNDCGLFSQFTNTMYLRMNYTKSNTLLLSASGHNLDDYWGGSRDNIKYWDDIPILHGDVKVKIHIEDITEKNPSNICENSFTIVPTVHMAQQLKIETQGNTELIHARFSVSDRLAIEDNLFLMYGKHAKLEKKPVIGTNIIGVGLNISARVINDGCITPEDLIQRCCGRGSRFGEYDTIEYNVLVCRNKKSGIMKYVSNNFDMGLYNKWIELLMGYDNQTLTKNDLYELRKRFYIENAKSWQNYLDALFLNSVNELAMVGLSSGSQKKLDKDTKRVSRGMTLRGEGKSVFVTVKTEDGYLNPIAIDEDLIYEGSNHDKERYDFMLETKYFNYPNKYALWNGYGIKKGAPVSNCLKLAYSNKTPLLLYDYEYTKDLGLYYIGNDE